MVDTPQTPVHNTPRPLHWVRDTIKWSNCWEAGKNFSWLHRKITRDEFYHKILKKILNLVENKANSNLTQLHSPHFPSQPFNLPCESPVLPSPVTKSMCHNSGSRTSDQEIKRDARMFIERTTTTKTKQNK